MTKQNQTVEQAKDLFFKRLAERNTSIFYQTLYGTRMPSAYELKLIWHGCYGFARWERQNHNNMPEWSTGEYLEQV